MTSYAVRTLSRMGKFAPAAATTLPLAMLACMANPALASPITLSSPTCYIPNNPGICNTLTVTNQPGGNSLNATVAGEPFSSQGAGHPIDVTLGISDSISGQLLTPETFTFAYDFTFDLINVSKLGLSYSIDFDITDSGCNGKSNIGACHMVANGMISGSEEIRGTASILAPAGSPTAESMTLIITDPATGKAENYMINGTMSVTDGTLDTPPAVTPEPASILLTGTGMALAALKRRRKSA